MSRQLKPQKIRDYRHERRGVTVEMFLDRNSHEFFFDFQNDRYTRPSLAELERLAHATIESATRLTWLPMITVEKLEPFARNGETFIGFTIKRSRIAQKSNGRWLEGDWDGVENGGQMNDLESWSHNFYVEKDVAFSLPHYGSSSYYLPYSEALWVGLETLLNHIRSMRATLQHLLTTPDGHKRVEQAATKRLGGGALALLPTVAGSDTKKKERRQ